MLPMLPIGIVEQIHIYISTANYLGVCCLKVLLQGMSNSKVSDVINKTIGDLSGTDV